MRQAFAFKLPRRYAAGSASLQYVNIFFAVPTARASSQVMMHDRCDSTNVLVPAGYSHDHGQRRKPAATSPCSGPYASTDLRCFSCAIHDPWKCVHENIETRKLRGVLLFKCCILIAWLYRWYWLAAVDVQYSMHVFYNALIAVVCWSIDFLHWARAFIPNSWFRSFCRTRFQARWDRAAELDDTFFA